MNSNSTCSAVKFKIRTARVQGDVYSAINSIPQSAAVLGMPFAKPNKCSPCPSAKSATIDRNRPPRGGDRAVNFLTHPPTKGCQLKSTD